MKALTVVIGAMALCQLACIVNGDEPIVYADYGWKQGDVEVSLEQLPGWTDEVSGAEIVQLTSRPVISTNVHMEERYTSADGNRVVIQRYPFGRPPEVWVCDLARRRMYRVGEGEILTASYARNAVYYVVYKDDVALLIRLDLAELTSRAAAQFEAGEALRRAAVSPDERWFVSGVTEISEHVYRLRRTDLESGETTTLCDVEDMWNPHLQFNPANPRQLLVQINRRGQTAEGPIGATLALVDVETGELQPLPVGVPHTLLISGHESWAGGTGRIAFTTGPGGKKATFLESRGVYVVTPGDDAPRPVGLGRQFNHLAVSDDGRFFIVDDWGTQEIFVGSMETGRYAKLCDSQTRQGRPQNSHAHPYMTPGNQHVIFVSNVTGVSQVYAAQIPAGFLEALEAPEEE